jgi:hypothetical protein
MFTENLRSSVLSGARVMTRRGDIPATELTLDDQILSYHAGFCSIEKLSICSIDSLDVVSVAPNFMYNADRLTVPAVQRLRVDREAVSTNPDKNIVLAQASRLMDGEMLVLNTMLTAKVVEIWLKDPSIIWVCGCMVELADPHRQEGRKFGTGKQPVDFFQSDFDARCSPQKIWRLFNAGT